MGNDIVIGKARVIAVEEITMDSGAQQPGILGGASGWTTTSPASLSAQVAPKSKKSIIVSRLKIESAGKTEGFISVEGIIMIPAQLPFGKTFELTLHDTGNPLEGNDRLFKEETS